MSTRRNVPQLQLAEVRLATVDLRPPPPEFSGARTGDLDWAVDVAVAYAHVAPPEAQVQLTAVVVYPEGVPRPFDLKLVLVGTFRSDAPVPPDQLADLAQTQLPRVLWPYLQETLVSLTSRAGGPVFPLPPMPEQLTSAPTQRKRTRSRRIGVGTAS